MLNRTLKFALVPTAPVIIGGVIYVLWRTPTLLMFRWFDAVGLSHSIRDARSATAWLADHIPAWILYSWPDAAWAATGVLLFAAIWSGSQLRVRHIWVFLTPAIGVSSELAQRFHLVPGTFDTTDLIACILSTLLSVYIANRIYNYAI